jgi:hypothetical protein
MQKGKWVDVPKDFFHIKLTHKRLRIGALVRLCRSSRDYQNSVSRIHKMMNSTSKFRSTTSRACVLDRSMCWRPKHARKTYAAGLMAFRSSKEFTVGAIAHEVWHLFSVVAPKQACAGLRAKPRSAQSEMWADACGGLIERILEEGTNWYER